jgi:spermidine synthase
MTDADKLRDVCVQLVNQSGLIMVGELFYAFPGSSTDEPGGVTGTVLLAESHLALHAWPEQQSVTLDVYVCNYSMDNSAKAEQLLSSLIQLFEPGHSQCQRWQRGDLSEPYSDLGQEYLNQYSSYVYGLGTELHREQSPYQLIEVHESPQWGRVFRLDGRYMTSEREEFFYHEALVHPAAQIHRQVQRVLILGGGDGGAAEELLKYSKINKITIAELDPAVITVSQQFLTNIHQNSLTDPRVDLHIGPGETYVDLCHEQFDLILLDLTDPDTPAHELYTESFFCSVQRRLAPGGIMVLHTGSPIFKPQCVQSIHQQLREQFNTVIPYGLYIPLYGTYWSFALCSDYAYTEKLERTIKEIGKLNYYNIDTHHAMFALPEYFKDLLTECSEN